VAMRELLRRHVFAYLTGNGDAHARNWGVLQDPDGEWRLSPAFDLPSSLPYGDTTMATTLGGRRQDLTRRIFRAFGASMGLPERSVDKAIDQQCAAVERWLPGLADLPFRGQVLDRWRRSVLHRRRLLGTADPV
ncbi:MAG: HipA domain-containing protein, partial [Chloroflexota bacterium]|nr:HipA domain-containing protein [Chloroflexota bacterium]